MNKNTNYINKYVPLINVFVGSIACQKEINMSKYEHTRSQQKREVICFLLNNFEHIKKTNGSNNTKYFSSSAVRWW
jgi:hypothetical protein